MVLLKKSKLERRVERLETGDCRYCFGGKDAPDPPDYAPIAEGSVETAQIAADVAREQLAWSKEQWAQTEQLLGDVLAVQLPAMQANYEAAQADRARYEQLYQPLEENLIQEFQDYGTPQETERRAGQAAADVTRAFQAQRDNALRSLESYGIDPSQTRYQALDAQMRVDEAAAQAAAMNQSRDNTEALSRSLRAEALNIGRGYPSQVAGAYGTALSAGNSAIGNQNSAVASGLSGYSAQTPFYNASTAAYGTAGNILNQGYANELNAWNSEQQYSPLNMAFGLAGTLGGAYLGGLADGGPIQAPGGPRDDGGIVAISNDEYVVPADIVKRKGTEFFDKLIVKTRQDQGIPDAQPPQPVRALPRAAIEG